MLQDILDLFKRLTVLISSGIDHSQSLKGMMLVLIEYTQHTSEAPKVILQRNELT